MIAYYLPRERAAWLIRPGYEIQWPYKDLNQGAATTLIAALDPSLEGEFPFKVFITYFL